MGASKKKKVITRPTITLTKTNGNVFAILGVAQMEWKKEGNPIDKWFTIKKEALDSGTYDGVLAVLNEYFDIE